MLIIDPMSVVIAVVLCLLGVGGGYLARKKRSRRQKSVPQKRLPNRSWKKPKKQAMPKRRKRCWKPRKKSTVSGPKWNGKTRKEEQSSAKMNGVWSRRKKNVDKKMDAYEKKEEKLLEQSNRLREAQAKVDALYDQQMVELERISGLTSEEAKQELLDNVREEVKHDKAR